MGFRLVLDPLPLDGGFALYDVTRLVRRRTRGHGTGVDRIELALARRLLAELGERCGFVCDGPLGPSLIARAPAAALLEALERRWRGAAATAPTLWPAYLAGLRRRLPADRAAETVYVNASHDGLAARAGALDRLDPARRLRRLCYVHDLIPLDYPEYQRPRSAARFRRFLAEMTAAPLTFVANSADTAGRLAALSRAEGWPVERIVTLIPRIAPDITPGPASRPRPAVRAVIEGAAPYFLTVGTIEPRKNHLLLLTLWRNFAAEGCAARLVIVGVRGWENEMVLDMLDRCPAMATHVVEFGDLVDAEVAALMRRARALLFPSFAEGLGVPLLEAAALGTPAIAADLPALREIAAPGTTFLHPLDGPGWRRAILAAAAVGASA